MPRGNANLGRTNVSPTTFGPGALDLDHQTRDVGRRPRRGQILATPVREQQARTRAAGMMPTGRHRYGPILGQILRWKGPKVSVKARGTSVRQDQLQIRRPSPNELGTGPTRPPHLPRVPTTRRHHGWAIRGWASPTTSRPAEVKCWRRPTFPVLGPDVPKTTARRRPARTNMTRMRSCDDTRLRYKRLVAMSKFRVLPSAAIA